jgi:digeranylgeranylglycerophospholipid reductase
MLYNAAIVGAGPIGSYLANKLTLLGHKVIVLEKKQAAGQSICCTGIISKECHDLLSIDNHITMRQANSAKFFTSSGRFIRLWRNEEVAYITDRASLDQALSNKAQGTGADYNFSTQVTSIEFETNRLLIKATSHNIKKVFESETAIIATGYGSDLTKNLGLGKIKDFAIGAQAEVKVNNIDEIEVYFDQRSTPGSFAWLVPTRENKGLAGLMTRHHPEFYLNQLLLKLKTQGKIDSTEVDCNYAVIPLRPLPKTYTNRILVVGDAAGQIKPTTGGGIYYGIICANIAANVLHQALKSGNLSSSRLSTYQKQWQSKLSRELTFDYWAKRLWTKLSNSHIEYLFSIVQKKHIPELITTTKKFPFDWHSQLLLQIIVSLLPFAKPQKKL